MAGSGSGPSDKDFDTTEGWRIALLFAAIIFVSVLVEKLIHRLDHVLSGKSKGLRDCFHHLQQEVMLVGLISLLLSATQEHLLKICIEDEDYPYYTSGYDDNHDSSYGDNHDSSYEREHDDHGTTASPYSPPTYDDHHRKLLQLYLAVGRTLLGGAVEHSCATGDEPFWSITLIHQTHIFIFAMGFTYIMYALTTAAITLWKVKRWNRWEDRHLMSEAEKAEQVKRGEKPEFLPEEFDLFVQMRAFRVIHSKFTSRGKLEQGNVSILGAYFSQFYTSVQPPSFLALRNLFLLKHRLPVSFPYMSYLSEAIEEDLSRIIAIDWKLWAIVALYIWANKSIHTNVPDLIWLLSIIAVVVSFVVSTHLEWMVAQLSVLGFKYNGKFQVIAEQDRKILAKSVLGRLGTVKMTGVDQTPTTTTTIAKNPYSEPQTNAERLRNQWMKALSPEVQTKINKARLAKEARETTAKDRRERRSVLREAAHKSLMADAGASDKLFWFGRPSYTLITIRLSMLINSLTIALCWFNWWQELEEIRFLWFVATGNLLLLIHTGLYCLPLFTLVVSTSSHYNQRALLLAEQESLHKENPLAAEVNSFNDVFCQLVIKMDALYQNEKLYEIKHIAENFNSHFTTVLDGKKALIADMIREIDSLSKQNIDVTSVQNIMNSNKHVKDFVDQVLSKGSEVLPNGNKV